MEGQGITTDAHWNVGTIKRPREFKINTSPIFFPSFLTWSLTLMMNWWARNLVKSIWERKYLGAIHIHLLKMCQGLLAVWVLGGRGRWGGHGWVWFPLFSPGSVTVKRDTDSNHIATLFILWVHPNMPSLKARGMLLWQHISRSPDLEQQWHRLLK